MLLTLYILYILTHQYSVLKKGKPAPEIGSLDFLCVFSVTPGLIRNKPILIF